MLSLSGLNVLTDTFSLHALIWQPPWLLGHSSDRRHRPKQHLGRAGRWCLCLCTTCTTCLCPCKTNIPLDWPLLGATHLCFHWVATSIIQSSGIVVTGEREIFPVFRFQQSSVEQRRTLWLRRWTTWPNALSTPRIQGAGAGFSNFGLGRDWVWVWVWVWVLVQDPGRSRHFQLLLQLQLNVSKHKKPPSGSQNIWKVHTLSHT